MNDLTFVKTNCLFCDREDDLLLYPPRFRKNSFTGYAFSARRNRAREHYRIVACRRCGLVRSNPILDESEINKLYGDSYFTFVQEAPYAARTYAVLLQQLIRRHIPAGILSLLEIGCSTGFFLEEALRMGIAEISGFEPSKDCLAKASERVKPHIINHPFDPQVLSRKTFDLVCGFHILDHLSDPAKTLTSIKSCLHPGSYILLVCHDVESWSAKLLGENSPIFDIEHIYLFSRRSIQRLLEMAGFQLLESGLVTNTYPLGYWIRMVPSGHWVVQGLPNFLCNLPITLPAGNLYAFGQRSEVCHVN